MFTFVRRTLCVTVALVLPGIAHAQRDSVLPSLATARARAAAVAPGPKPFVTLLCRFPDFPEVLPGTRAHFDSIMTSPSFPSVAHYWKEVSYGAITMEGSRVYGWYDLPQPMSEYVRLSGFGVDFNRLEQDCAAAADADVVFPDFHGINIVVNTNLDGRLYAGAAVHARDGVSRLYPTTYLDGIVATSFGFAAHEIGHTFGLPHTSGPYGAEYDSKWDVMSLSSWWQQPGGSLYLPVHPNAWQKLRLGVIPASRQVVTGVGDTTILLERLGNPQSAENPLVVTIPIYGQAVAGGESYYTLEVRGGPGSGYDAGHPQRGVVIHRLRNFEGLVVLDVDGNGDPNDAGALWTPGETFVDRANGIEVSVEAEVGAALRVTVRVSDRRIVSLAPSGASRTLASNTLVQRPDSARVAFGGSGTDVLPWTAVSIGRSRRLSTTSSGTGPGIVRWTENPAGLAPGTYVDTIRVLADGLANVGVFVDTLIVTAAPTLAVGLGARSQSDSLLPERVSPLRTVSVRVQGPGADTVSWTASRTATWIDFTGGSSTGRGLSGAVTWRHTSAGLPVGTHVDTMVVTPSTGGTVSLVDTLRVLPGLTITTGRAYGSATAAQASSSIADSVFVTIAGPWAAGALLDVASVTGTGSFLRGMARTGSGWLQLRRIVGSLPPGMYVNRMRIALAADTATRVYYEDTLRVLAAPPRIVLSRNSARDSVNVGSSLSIDSVYVQPEGEGGPIRRWETSASVPRVVFLPRNGTQPYGSGNGPGWLVWVRNSAGILPGSVSVDTLTVRFSSGPGDAARIVDSLAVGGSLPLTITSLATRGGGIMGKAYDDTLRATGGTGTWQWSVSAGALPPGLSLDVSGRVSGVPEASGSYSFTATVVSGERVAARDFTVEVLAPVLLVSSVFDRLLGEGSLSADELRYLDLQGNRNGRFDVGDARAWLQRQPPGAAQP